MKQLPAGTTSWMPELSSLHATIFHPGLAPGTAASPRLVAPSAQALDRELHTARRFASSVPANLTLVVDRLTVSPSGVMLLLLRPAHDGGAIALATPNPNPNPKPIPNPNPHPNPRVRANPNPNPHPHPA